MMKKMMFLGILSTVLSCGSSGSSGTDPTPPTTPVVTPTCSDSAKNGTESDVDCGGSCQSCVVGKSCQAATDCSSGACTSGVCAAPTCSDGVKNASETDVDCGGSCGACADLKSCSAMTDCTSGICQSNKCVAPSCMDQVKNGTESDTDCGGTCGGCNLGKTCAKTTDCATSSICEVTSKTCRTAVSCAEILAGWPQSADGAFKIAPTGTATPFDAVCDMKRDGGGWTLLLKATTDNVMGYSSAYWTDSNLLSETDLTTAQGNAKYPAYLALPVTTLRGELDGYRFPLKIDGGMTAQQIFAGPTNTVSPYPVPIDTSTTNWSVQPNCQYFGVNDAYNYNKVRFGWTANQENDCNSNDTAIGLGVVNPNNGSAHGAGYQCASSGCSNGPTVDVGGSGLLWAQ